MEDFIIKYFWGVFGLVFCSVFVFVKILGQVVMNMGDCIEFFVMNRCMFFLVFDVFGRIMFLYREVMEFVGYIFCVVLLLDVMDDIQVGYFEKKFVLLLGMDDN